MSQSKIDRLKKELVDAEQAQKHALKLLSKTFTKKEKAEIFDKMYVLAEDWLRTRLEQGLRKNVEDLSFQFFILLWGKKEVEAAVALLE